MLETISNGSGFAFLNLPGEIREVIYKQILVDNPIVYDSCYHWVRPNRNADLTMHIRSHSPLHRQRCTSHLQDGDNPEGKTGPSPYNIVFASKILSSEFLYYAYKSPITFVLRHEKTTNFQQWDVSLAVLSNIEVARFQYDMEDTLWPTGLDEREIYVPGLVPFLPQLKRMEAEVVITRELTDVDFEQEHEIEKGIQESYGGDRGGDKPRMRVIHPIDFEEMCESSEGGSYVIS